MDLSNLILILLLISFGIFFNKYFIKILANYNSKILIDDQFNKPQAFHTTPISVAGGVGIFFSLLILHFYYLLKGETFFFEYLSFCTLFFILGFLDDMKVYVNPKIRLSLMIIFLIILVQYNNFYLLHTGIYSLNNWIENSKLFSLIFICLCFLFIINGANLIDGYNGLLTLHSLIIITNLFLINYLNANYDLAIFLLFSIIILTIFLIFNFPKGKIFLGDGGAYLLGSFIAISVVKTNLANPDISPFYFCILLFYLFFEVFFSFFRKLIKEKTSPIQPDKKHLHMLIYKTLLKKNINELKSNYYVSIIINFAYFILTIPAILLMNNGLFCKYYSVVFFVVYFISYKIAYAKTK